MVTKFIRTGIADKNESPPYFDKALYEAEVDENEDIQHTVLTVTANSHNDTSNIRYEITGGNVGGAFGVTNTTGAIYVASPLDYETKKKYELRLAAIDNHMENFTTVAIHVRDVNDNPPVFERPTYRTQITEEDDRNLPKRILQVTAIDGDKDGPQKIVYFPTGQGIDTDNLSNSKFDVNRTTGEIFVLKPLDRDQPHGRPQWRFTVFAQDEDGEGLVGYADVQVNLKDINDNAPIFPQTVYIGNVTENGTAGTIVMIMSAVDYDDPGEGNNAKLIYSIEKNVIEEESGIPIFEIDPHTGVIKTAVCCLDREKTPDYTIQVVAVDGGGLKGTGTASIKIKDINDMPPHFTKDEWITEVDETDEKILPVEPILVVTVQDEDETNDFFYKVVENSGFGAEKFSMVKNPDNSGSLKIIGPLDFEDPLQSNGFRFRIQVSDKGEDDKDKSHVAYSWVVIKLKDINDNEPQFEKSHLSVAVDENAEVGKMLEKFKAVDADQGGKSKIFYSIDRSSDRKRQFYISQEGVVSIQRPLDREDIPKHELKVLAIDDGIPPKTATATLTVSVLDINDNAPKFAKDYRPVILEHSIPQKVADIYAIDDDDRSKGNGPPFQFRLDPAADDIIRASFKVEQFQNGDGMSIITSLRSFDREQQKEYLVPIIIKDSGNPAQTGTSTLTVIVGDINDNKMDPGSKEIFVFNYQGQAPDSDIGSIYVDDVDDWDVPDKKFYWEGTEHSRFRLNEETGMIQMKQGTRNGLYHLRFKVYDRKHGQTDISANVTVTVREINSETVSNSGSIRLSGVTDEDFIKIWDYKSKTLIRSIYDKFREKLASILNLEKKYVNIFSVQSTRKYPPITDVRFGINVTPKYKSERLNGMVLMHRDEIERDVGINITMVGIDECLFENQTCKSSCTNVLDMGNHPYMINANKTAFGGVKVNVQAKCICGARNFTKLETCRPNPCLNGGRCIEGRYGISCSCPAGYNGPKCQQTSRSFRGNGWAWYPALEMCDDSHLSFEFITRKQEGIFLYNGPIVPHSKNEILVSDFISVELEKGYPRLLVDFGSGTLELRITTKNSLDDGEWHRIDIFWTTEKVKMIVDYCKTAVVEETEDGASPEFDDSTCQAQGIIPPFNEYLNVNTPLQIGGLFIEQFDPANYDWKYMPVGKSFDGCIKNLQHNSKLYDLAHPALSRNSVPGCPQTEEVCNQLENTGRCWEHGICVGNFFEAHCECDPGYTGPTCASMTIPTTFRPQSYVKFALSFEPDRFSTQIQLRFRTREQLGELFRISDQHNREYGILEIRDAKLHFRYNLNSQKKEEKDVWLSTVLVDDGQWHVAKVNRFGSTAILELDGGEGRYYNETFVFEGHQWLLIDKQEGVYAGGKAEYTGVRTFDVNTDFKKGCIDDIRFEGKHLPLPPAMNGSQWGQATMARNLDKGCASHSPCISVNCPEPFECVDLWNEYECTCGAGRVMAPDGKGCTDKNECLDQPCLNGGKCINQEPKLRYRCICPDGFWGENCELVQEEQTLKLSMGAFAAIVICLTIIFLLVLIIIIYNRRRKAKVKYPCPDEDVRENIISYADEGGGEDDMTAFDIKTIQIPVGEPPPPPPLPQQPLKIPFPLLPPGQEPNVKVYIEEYKKQADIDQNAPPFDDLRNYAFEGGGSVAGSLSSLASGTDDELQDYKYLGSWGPNFVKLAEMYTQTHEPENEDEKQEK
ncbi:cadherin-N2 [Arctopsyche grandis]|uniref:cadherin-N2 n=1 Tax=Arctopsyche grandis TaxID=121162 RepID=UPI00406D75DF